MTSYPVDSPVPWHDLLQGLLYAEHVEVDLELREVVRKHRHITHYDNLVPFARCC
jgi:hypothetical protein